MQTGWGCFISTKVNPRHSQTTKWSITDHFSINKIHQGPFQTCLTEKIQEFEDFGLLAGWVKMSPKETSPGHLLNNSRANQTWKWTNTYPTNGNQSHPGAFRHIRPTLRSLKLKPLLWWFSLALFHSAASNGTRFHSPNLYHACACDIHVCVRHSRPLASGCQGNPLKKSSRDRFSRDYMLNCKINGTVHIHALWGLRLDRL